MLSSSLGGALGEPGEACVKVWWETIKARGLHPHEGSFAKQQKDAQQE
jgi:hypothetical protein